MPKRFTDTQKWNKPFIRSLKAPYKLLWFYILDECDHAGIWQVDFQVAQIKIGEKINKKDAIQIFNNKIIILDNGEKWFIPSFIEFQYGELQENNRAHRNVIYLLTKYELINEKLKFKPLTSPLQGSIDIYKEKEEEKEQAKEEEGNIPNLQQVKDYFKLKGYKEEIAIKAFEYYDANNWKDKDGKKVLSWKQKMIGVWFVPENKIQEGSNGQYVMTEKDFY